jgi:phospholipid-binding lipoprotein MlaA
MTLAARRRGARRLAGATLAVFLASAAAPALVVVPEAAWARDDGDPLEPLNRAIFKFNDTLDVYLLEPLARGWNFIVPPAAQDNLDNFFTNLRFPVIFANSVLQAKPTRAGIALGRFTINTAFGVGGLFDPAAAAGLEPFEEDFGQTLGRWGVGPGPYLVLPLLGPSNPRDALGLIADAPMRVWPYFVDQEVVWISTGVYVVNTRSLFLDFIEETKRDSLDYYAAVRDAYLQRRRALIEDRRPDDEQEPAEDDLYFPDFEDESGESAPEPDTNDDVDNPVSE